MKGCLLIILYFLFPFYSLSQVNLEFSYKQKPIITRFNSVKVINNRDANSFYGFVQKGLSNRKEFVTFNGTFNDSIAYFFLTNSIPGKELVMILDDFNLSEKTEQHSETGRFKLSLRFFENVESNKYVEIFSIDTAYEFNSMDVTKHLLNEPTNRFNEISTIINKITNPISDIKYSYSELLKIDSIEKMKIPVYSAFNVAEGVYRTFEQFSKNNPDTLKYKIDEEESGKIKVFEVTKNRKGKLKFKKLEPVELYSFTFNGKLFKANSMGFFEMYKQGFDFYYNGQTSFTVSQSKDFDSFNYFLTGGIAGSLAGSLAHDIHYKKNNSDYFTFKINYKKGNSILYSFPR
jgi:hypothetical protein